MIGDRDDLRVEDHWGTDDGSLVVDLKPDGAKAKDASDDDGGNIDVGKLQAKLKEVQDRADARSVADRRARDAAEADAQKARSEVHVVKSNLMTSEFHTITNALDAEKARGDALERDLETAYSTGNAKDIAATNRKIAQSEARMLALEDGARRLDHNIRTRPAEPQAEPRVRNEEPEDQAEAMIAKVKSPRTQEFLRDRKDWLRDPKLHAKMVGFHHIAVSEGHTVDSQDYLDYIDQNMAGKKRSERDDETERDDRERRDSRRTVAAPVSRDGASDVRQGTVRLSAEQREIARAQGYTDAEYGRLLVRVEKLQGKNKDGVVRFVSDQLN